MYRGQNRGLKTLGPTLTAITSEVYNNGKRGALRQAVDLCKMKGYLKLRQPSLCRVAVVAFYANCDGETKHMKSQRNGHAHHLLSVNDGQPPAL